MKNTYSLILYILPHNRIFCNVKSQKISYFATKIDNLYCIFNEKCYLAYPPPLPVRGISPKQHYFVAFKAH